MPKEVSAAAKKPVTITFLIASMSKRGGGPPNEVASLSATLAAEYPGIRVRILAFSANDNVPMAANVSSIWLSPAPTKILATCRQFRRALGESDFVFVWGVWGLLEGLLFGLLRPADIRYAVKTLGMMESYIMSRNRGRKTIARHLYLDRNLREAKAVLVDSETERSRIRQLGFTGRIDLCRNGVVVQPPALHQRQSGQVLYMGRIVPKKGLDFLLEVFAQVRSRHPLVRLVVAGAFADEEFQRLIRDKIELLGLQAAVVFVGQVDGTRKRQLLEEASCFVLPSYSEGFSNAVLEALSSGTPVLITPECNFPEVETERLGHVIPRETGQWVKALNDFFEKEARKILATPEIRKHMAENYTWSATAHRMHALANELPR